MDAMNFGSIQPFGQSNPGQNRQVYEYSRLNLAAVSREQSADITFVTQEGDKVTLSADASFEAAYSTYDSQAQINGSYAESSGRLNTAAVEGEVAISVEGDLNEQEQKEIKQVLSEIFTMMRNFLSGRMDDEPATSLKDIELDTLATIEAKFEVKESSLEVDRTSAAYATDSSIPEGESEGDKPTVSLIRRMADALKDSKVRPDRFLKHFGHRPGRLSNEFMAQAPEARQQRKMVNRVFAELFQQLEKMSNISKADDHSDFTANEDAMWEPEPV